MVGKADSGIVHYAQAPVIKIERKFIDLADEVGEQAKLHIGRHR